MTRAWEPPEEPLAAARGILRGLLWSLVIWALLIVTAVELAGQVAPVVRIANGRAETLVRNPAREALRFTVELWRTTDSTPVRALIAPSVFTLAPGEAQTVRLRVRDVVAPGTTLRLRTCFQPLAPPTDPTRAVAVLMLRTCILAKAVT